MKTIKTSLLPIAILLIGAGSAFATNLSKDAKQALRPGHVIREDQPEQCQDAGIECQDTGSVICTVNLGMGSEPVYEKVGSTCVNNLYFN
ncbi:DUF6520 family protein [Chryseobacterium sp. GP-SGM7]|uniref:DUF6520 family protein n=1 Tax=Chryseobacterium sp. GP-SGM7 TaxID=3411323 RepID=UPI003B932138